MVANRKELVEELERKYLAFRNANPQERLGALLALDEFYDLNLVTEKRQYLSAHAKDDDFKKILSKAEQGWMREHEMLYHLRYEYAHHLRSSTAHEYRFEKEGKSHSRSYSFFDQVVHELLDEEMKPPAEQDKKKITQLSRIVYYNGFDYYLGPSVSPPSIHNPQLAKEVFTAKLRDRKCLLSVGQNLTVVIEEQMRRSTRQCTVSDLESEDGQQKIVDALYEGLLHSDSISRLIGKNEEVKSMIREQLVQQVKTCADNKAVWDEGSLAKQLALGIGGAILIAAGIAAFGVGLGMGIATVAIGPALLWICGGVFSAVGLGLAGGLMEAFAVGLRDNLFSSEISKDFVEKLSNALNDISNQVEEKGGRLPTEEEQREMREAREARFGSSKESAPSPSTDLALGTPAHDAAEKKDALTEKQKEEMRAARLKRFGQDSPDKGKN